MFTNMKTSLKLFRISLYGVSRVGIDTVDIEKLFLLAVPKENIDFRLKIRKRVPYKMFKDSAFLVFLRFSLVFPRFFILVTLSSQDFRLHPTRRIV